MEIRSVRADSWVVVPAHGLVPIAWLWTDAARLCSVSDAVKGELSSAPLGGKTKDRD